MEEGVPIEHGMVTRAIERAQKQVEAQNFSVRKHLLEYDDVMNKQRESVYTLRREILEGKVHLTEEETVDTRAYTLALAEDILEDQIDRYAGEKLELEEWDVPADSRCLACVRPRPADPRKARSAGKDAEEIGDAIWSPAKTSYGPDRRQRAAAACRTRHHAADRRSPVERPPLLARSPQGRHRAARLRSARSARGIQEGKLRAVPGHEGRIEEEMVPSFWLRPC